MRDVAQVRHAGVITTEVAREALDLLEVDEQGLERMDRELLEALRQQQAVQQRMHSQLDRYRDEFERVLAELETIRGHLVSASASTDNENR